MEDCSVKKRKMIKTRNQNHHLFDQLQDPIFVVEARTRTIRYCNPAAEEMFGYSASELLGNTTEALHVDQAHYRQFGKDSEQVLEREGIYRNQFNMRRRDGTPFPTSNIVVLTKSIDGAAMAISLVRDESMTALSEHHGSIIQELSNRIGQADTLEPALNGIFDVLCPHFQWDYGEAWVAESDDSLAQRSVWARPGSDSEKVIGLTRSIRLSSNEGLPARVWQTGESAWISDIQEALAPEMHRRRPLADAAGLKSTLVVPAIDTGKVTAVFVFASQQTRQRDLSAQMTHEYLLTLAGPALRDLVVKEQMRPIDEETLQALFVKYPLPLWICEPRSLQILATNNAALKAEGITKKAPPRTLADRLPGKSIEDLAREIELAAARGESLAPVLFENSEGVRTWTTMFPYWVNKKGQEQLVVAAIKRQRLKQRQLADASPANIKKMEAAFQSLSPREKQVIEHLIEGRLNKEIAYEMNLSQRTVEDYRASLRKKLGVKTAAELFAALATFGNGRKE